MALRPALSRRVPIAPAALVLAAFAVAGVAVVDDYGVTGDVEAQRRIGQVAVDYLGRIGQTAVNSVLPGAAGRPAVPVPAGPDYDSLIKPVVERYYGGAFEGPLVLAERLLGFTDTRAVFLSRHLLTHLFFLTGGLFCYLLVYRLFGDRRLALFALLLFLLHPRLYGHSFVNTKDIPFLAMFMIALYLLERAFRRDRAAAFALCGAGVGVLVNLRIMGLTLFAAGAGLRALDLLLARGPAERRRVLAGAGAFALAAAGTLYALSPYLWGDPLAIVDAVTAIARHPSTIGGLFRGEPVRWPWLPPHYVPTWMAITTPPATLLLCLAGAAAVIRRAGARPRYAAGNTELRFALLLAACLALPPAAAAAANANLYNGWRQMYFLYAPACLLAVYGLRALLAGARRLAAAAPRGMPVRQGSRRGRRCSTWLRGAPGALAAAALAGMAVDVVRLHPHQMAYFNFLVDRRTPEYLRTQYRMLYWGTEFREALEYLLARFPGATLHVDSDNQGHLYRNRLILPAAARRRIVIGDTAERSPDFFITRTELPADPLAPVLYARRIYRSTLLAVTALDLSLVDDQATADGYRAAFGAALREAYRGEPAVRSDFDLYLDGGALTYVKEPCGPEDIVRRFLLRAVPDDVADLPLIDRERGWEQLDFRFGRYGARLNGRCLIRRPLPDYPIRALEVGRLLPEVRYLRLLEAVIDLSPEQPPVGGPWPAHAAIVAGRRGAPAAGAAPAGRAGFDLYLDDDAAELTYHKEPCAPDDLRERFYLHVFPADPAELAAHERQSGFHNRGFYFSEFGVLLRGGACVALVPLPVWEHGIARIRTSQGVIGQEALWQVEFAATRADRAGQSNGLERGVPAGE